MQLTFDHNDSASFLHGVGVLYWRGGNKDKGMIFMLLATKIAPNDTDILRSLVTMYVEQGDGERALATIQKIAELEGDAAELQALKSQALWVNGDVPAARRMFQEYLSKRTSP